MDASEILKTLTGSAIGVVALMVVLNWSGQLLWKAQVDREIKAIVDAKEKLDAVRVEQIEEERKDKNEEKETTQVALKSIMDALRENRTVLDSLNGRIKAGSS